MTWFIQTMTIVIALIFAWGGMEMVMSGGDEGKVHHGKEKMTNSIVGFIILLSAWLVVDTVLKTFVTGAELGVWNAIQCVDPVARTQTSTPGSVSTLPSGTLPSSGLAHSDARAVLGGINVVSSGNCTDRTNKSCTSLDGIQQQALTEIKSVISSCTNCNLEITAGTEIGHSNSCHTNGTCVDIRCANGCSLDQVAQVDSTAKANGARVVYETLDCGARDAAIARGVRAYCQSDSGYGHITGNHFSLYTE